MVRVLLWTDQRGEFAVCKRGDQLMRARTAAPLFVNKVIDTKDIKESKIKSYDDLLDDWVQELKDDEILDEDGYMLYGDDFR